MQVTPAIAFPQPYVQPCRLVARVTDALIMPLEQDGKQDCHLALLLLFGARHSNAVLLIPAKHDLFHLSFVLARQAHLTYIAPHYNHLNQISAF